LVYDLKGLQGVSQLQRDEECGEECDQQAEAVIFGQVTAAFITQDITNKNKQKMMVIQH
jgi:hypothetical protein